MTRLRETAYPRLTRVVYTVTCMADHKRHMLPLIDWRHGMFTQKSWLLHAVHHSKFGLQCRLLTQYNAEWILLNDQLAYWIVTRAIKYYQATPISIQASFGHYFTNPALSCRMAY
eukprot:2036165-Pleurochrysis_carterae.AAC.3